MRISDQTMRKVTYWKSSKYANQNEVCLCVCVCYVNGIDFVSFGYRSIRLQLTGSCGNKIIHGNHYEHMFFFFFLGIVYLMWLVFDSHSHSRGWAHYRQYWFYRRCYIDTHIESSPKIKNDRFFNASPPELWRKEVEILRMKNICWM